MRASLLDAASDFRARTTLAEGVGRSGMNTLARSLGIVAFLLMGCAKRAADEGKRPVERAAPPSPPPSLAADAPSKAPEKPVLQGRDLCRGERLPADQHYVPEGMCAVAVATGQGALRDIDFTPNGDLIGVRKDGTVLRYRDVNQNGVFDAGGAEILEWASTGGNGHNCTFADDFLYCGSKAGVVRFRYGGGNAKAEPGEPVVTGQPGDGNHPIHSVRAYDGMLYVVSGSADNSIDPMPRDYDRERAVVKRFRIADFGDRKPLPWKDGELFVSGVRNATALGRGPKGRIYAGINNLDDVHYAGVDVHEDNPGEVLLSLEKGKRYGYPFCFHAARIVRDGSVVPPGTPLRADVKKGKLGGMLKSTKDDAWCAANSERPMSFFQAHSSVLDLELVPTTSTGLPPRYAGGLLATLHGSWNRETPTGYKVVFLPLDAEGNAPMPTATPTEIRFPYEVVFGGGKRGVPQDGQWSWKGKLGSETLVRPVGLAISPVDGALYVSSDNAPVGLGLPLSKNDGALYRIAVER
jgi:glucose/arabinose dehydrogenase